MDDDFSNSGWTEKGRTNVFDCGWFRVDRQDRVSQSSGVEHDFYLIKTADRVNVIPVRSDGCALIRNGEINNAIAIAVLHLWLADR